MIHGRSDQGYYGRDRRRYQRAGKVAEHGEPVNNSIKKTQSQLRDVNNLLKLDPSNTILLAQKQELLQAAIGDTEKKLEALEQAQEDVAKAFERGDLGKGQYMAFQREVEETRGTLNRYKADLSGLQSEQERLATNAERLNRLFAVTSSSVDDYADVLGSRLVTAIRNGTASSDQLKTAVEKIGKAVTGGKADIKQLTAALDTVDDGQAVQNLIEDLNGVGDAARNAADDIGEIAQATKGAVLMEAADQLSAVGNKIQDVGDKAVSAYAETETAVSKVNAYFGETGGGGGSQRGDCEKCVWIRCGPEHGCGGGSGHHGQEEPWRSGGYGSDQPDEAGADAGRVIRD